MVQAMSAWSVKTQRTPSRHCRGARVYGHTATAMHDNEYPPPGRAFKHGLQHVFFCLGFHVLSTLENVHFFLRSNLIVFGGFQLPSLPPVIQVLVNTASNISLYSAA